MEDNRKLELDDAQLSGVTGGGDPVMTQIVQRNQIVITAFRCMRCGAEYHMVEGKCPKCNAEQSNGALENLQKCAAEGVLHDER